MARPFSFCLCADDYAMTPGVSRGIVEALAAGALTATSAITTSPWWDEAAIALAPFIGRADLGLHLNLTLGAPLGPMPTLAPDGRLPGIGTIMRLTWRDALPLDEIAAEIDRQAERFEAVLGRAPDHVDGHQHVQILRPIRPLVVATLERRGWRPWLRDSGDGPARIVCRRVSVAKALGLALLSRGFRDDAWEFPTNQGFAGFSSFDPGSAYGEDFTRYLSNPGPRHLVMCHPGYVDDHLRAIDPVVGTREKELAFLMSPDFATTLGNAGASLARMGDMP